MSDRISLPESREGTGLKCGLLWVTSPMASPPKQRNHFPGIPVPQPTPLQHPLQAATGPEQAVITDQKEHQGDFPLCFLNDPSNTLKTRSGGRVKASFTRLSTGADRHTHTVCILESWPPSTEETEIPVSCRLKTMSMLQLRQPRKVLAVLGS